MKSKLIVLILSFCLFVPQSWGAVDFDGTEDYIDTGYDPVIGSLNDFSFSFWFRADNVPVGVYSLVGSIAEKGANDPFVTVQFDDTNCTSNGEISFILREDGSATSQTICTGTTYEDGAWHHLIAKYDTDGNMVIRIDGTQAASAAVGASANGSYNLSSYPFYVGARNSRGSVNNLFNGQIDDFRFYDRAFNDKEYNQLYNSRRKRLGGLMDFKSNLTATDRGSGSNDGTLVSSPVPASDCGFDGGCVEFDGADDQIQMGDVLDMGTGDLSISAWFKWEDSSPASNIGVVSKRTGSGSIDRYGMEVNTSNFARCLIDDPVSSAIVSASTNTVNDQEWHHVVCLFDRSANMDIYLDNVNEDTDDISSLSGDNINNAEDLVIGSFSDDINYFDGFIDDVRIYNDLLTADEITYIYTKGASGSDPGTANLTGYWDLNDTGAGLVVHYEMDDKEIGHVAGLAEDSSANNNHGEFFGFDNLVTSFTTDISTNAPGDTALTFDGTNDYVEISSRPIIYSDAKTITAWIMRHTTSNDSIVSTRAEGGTDGGWALKTVSNKLRYAHIGNGFIDSISSLSTGTWHHVAISYTSTSQMELYIDGVDDTPGSETITGGTLHSEAKTFIGLDGSGRMDGIIDDARMYNVALSTQDVSDIYNNVSISTEPVAHWKLNDSAVKDATGNGNHGKGVGGDSLVYTGGTINRR